MALIDGIWSYRETRDLLTAGAHSLAVADVRWIVTRHIPCVGADDDRDDQRLAVNGVGRDHQDRSAPSLFPTVSGAEVDEVNLATANHP